ncbi:MAG: T9SS type A sorting domain-containing protein [Saprospiraceae bacterium]
MTLVNKFPNAVYANLAFLVPKQLQTIALLILMTGFFHANLLACADNDPSIPLGIVPTKSTFPGGPPQCGGLGSYRINSPNSGITQLDLDGNGSIDITINITVGACGEVLTWTTSGNVVLDQLVAKGGTVQNTYDYTGINPRPSTDGNLHCPLNASGKYADFSHIDFCFHHRLDVSKTAQATFTRTYSWSLDKICEGPPTLILTPGQVYDYPFSWTSSFSFTDSDWKVSGNITIANNTPHAATITNVSDILSGGESATLNCGIPLPINLASGATLNCSYTASLNAPYNGINTVTVQTSTALVEGGKGTAAFAFGSPTTKVDACITVTDDCTGSYEVCEDNPYGKVYSCPITYSECGQYTYTNTVSFTTNNTQSTGSDACSVQVSVPCNGGCTLTIGYWKTHSIYGPAPYDNTWAEIGEDTPFFLSGKSWYGAAWTPPAGNAYYILAHQYIAAQLNFLNGADIPAAVQAAFNAATTLFNTYTPAQIAAMGGNNPIRKQFVNLAKILDNYNNGITGPGHCSEQMQKVSIDRGAEPVEAADFHLYPNPASDEVQIDLSNFLQQSVELALYNQLGAMVFDLRIKNVNSVVYTLQLDKSLPNGYYHLTLLTGDKRLSKSLILSK